MAFHWGEFAERPLFRGEVCLKIDMGRFDTFVAEPQGNDGDIYSGLQQVGYFCPSRRKGKMSLAGARESRSAGDAGSCQRWRSRARGVSTEACSAPVFSQIGKKYPPAYTGDLTDLRSGLVGVFVQDSGVF